LRDLRNTHAGTGTEAEEVAAMKNYQTTSSVCPSTGQLRAATAHNGFGAGTRVPAELRSGVVMFANPINVDVAATGPQVWSPPV
jgi:hypothetical protein